MPCEEEGRILIYSCTNQGIPMIDGHHQTLRSKEAYAPTGFRGSMALLDFGLLASDCESINFSCF